MATTTALSPVRNWIVAELTRLLPEARTYWSNSASADDKAKFKSLTGVDQTYLDNTWSGSDSKFTTCSSFLPRFATRVRQNGRMPTKFTNKWGNTFDINLGGFALNKEVGWVPHGVYDDPPRPGDFFMLGHDNWTDHVGIVLEVEGGQWSTVSGGAGGRGQQRDGVKRTDLYDIPSTLMGWMDVDVYFSGWAGPGA